MSHACADCSPQVLTAASGSLRRRWTPHCWQQPDSPAEFVLTVYSPRCAACLPVHMCCGAGELDAFLARASRGRNEVELSRRDETDKRQNRFRALVQVRTEQSRLLSRGTFMVHAMFRSSSLKEPCAWAGGDELAVLDSGRLGPLQPAAMAGTACVADNQQPASVCCVIEVHSLSLACRRWTACTAWSCCTCRPTLTAHRRWSAPTHPCGTQTSSASESCWGCRVRKPSEANLRCQGP